MYEQETIALIKNSVAFMGTIDHDNRPRVRPMKPYIDREGHIWLFSSHDTQKITELARNPRIELCIVGPHREVLTLAGRIQDETKPGTGVFRALRDLILAEVPEAKYCVKDNNLDTLVIYRFILHHISLYRPDGQYTTSVNLPMSQNPDTELALCQGGFCLIP